MIFVGHMHAKILSETSRDQLLATIASALFNQKFQLLIFLIITLSVISTSMALALVFSDYLRIKIFKNKFSHKICLFISVFISFVMSVIGFERLALLIAYMMAGLYPLLVLVTMVAFAKKLSPPHSINV